MNKNFELNIGDYSLSVSSDDSNFIEDIASGSWEVSGNIDSDNNWSIQIAFGD